MSYSLPNNDENSRDTLSPTIRTKQKFMFKNETVKKNREENVSVSVSMFRARIGTILFHNSFAQFSFGSHFQRKSFVNITSGSML